MQKVIVRVPGAGSFVIESLATTKEVAELLYSLMIKANWAVVRAVRGAPKKVKPEASVVSEGAAGVSE